ncbi:MAG: D-aminoacyl-tRNA deacylase [Candidatus Wallbacteria bacterium]|nr:D-aminoacyl-tRNA deacylase [Candidatus Wallbacteria bacterium]
MQRVDKASVTIDGHVTGSISCGLLVLLGIGKADTEAEAEFLAHKLVNLRIFNDSEGKMNLSLADICGQMLIISQFTLYASTRKGNRPSFTDAMPPHEAEQLYLHFIQAVEKLQVHTERGIFGAHMQIELCNNGPVSIMVYSRNEG